MEPGWYPDPRDASALRYFDGDQWTDQTNPPTAGGASTPPAAGVSGRRSVPTWALVAGGALVVLVAAVIVTATQLSPSPTRSEAESPTAGTASTSTSPRPNPLKSKMVPELTFPRGSLVASRQPGEPEIWGVPLPFVDTVHELGRMLPLGEEYDGIPWKSERVDETKTVWQWGDEPASLTVTINRNNAQSTNVYLDRT